MEPDLDNNFFHQKSTYLIHFAELPHWSLICCAPNRRGSEPATEPQSVFYRSARVATIVVVTPEHGAGVLSLGRHAMGQGGEEGVGITCNHEWRRPRPCWRWIYHINPHSKHHQHASVSRKNSITWAYFIHNWFHLYSYPLIIGNNKMHLGRTQWRGQATLTWAHQERSYEVQSMSRSLVCNLTLRSTSNGKRSLMGPQVSKQRDNN